MYEADLQIYGSAIRKSVLDGQGPPAPPNTSGNGSFDYQLYEDTIEQDRQWLAPDPTDGSIVYFAYHDLAAEQEIVAKSLDGGKTFPIHVVASNNPALALDTGVNTYSGPIRVDPADHNTIALVYGISTSDANLKACNPDTACFGFAKIVVAAVSADGGLTFQDVVAMGRLEAARQRHPREHLPVGPGTTRATSTWWPQWAAPTPTGTPRTASSTPRLATRARPGRPMIRVNKGSGAVVFPTMAGGKGGVVDFSWLESTAADQAANGTWTVHFAQSRNAPRPCPPSRK